MWLVNETQGSVIMATTTKKDKMSSAAFEHGIIFADSRDKSDLLDDGLDPDFEKLLTADIEFTDEDVEAMDPTQIYLRDIGFRPLLTAAEEVTIGKQVQAGDKKAAMKIKKEIF